MLPVAIPVGSQGLHAVGAAWAMKLRREAAAVLVYFGDGATSEGEMLEAFNFAGVFQAPVVFLCSNNQYAISMPRGAQTAADTIAQKAVAFGFPGIQIYGNDLLAVYGAVKEGLERARSESFKSVVVLGHENYYPKFGFTAASAWNISAPIPVPDEVFMAIELKAGSLTNAAGVVRYAPEFGII